jgi:putative hydrolase of the HAD superfamily
MNHPKVLFFDAAGTLFDVKGSVAEIYLSYAGKYGVKQTNDLLVQLRGAFARAFRDAPPPVFAASEPAEIKRCERLWWFDIVHNVFYRIGMFDRFDDYFDEIFEAFADPRHWVLYPDTLEVLNRIRQLGIEMGIVSNFDTRLFGVLRGLDIAHLFDSVTISSIAHAAKPSPRIFEVALEKHVMDPQEAWHIGDSLLDDVEGARKAGLTPVLLDRSDRGGAASRTESSSIWTIHTLHQLEALLNTHA